VAQTDVETDRRSPPSTPRWVKLFGIIALVLLLLFGGMHVTGSSQHGPGRHMPAPVPTSAVPQP
jgi:hypothetical protein